MSDVRQNNTTAKEREQAADLREGSTSGHFLRGLTLGALVGAAIAGSAVWDRLRKHDDGVPAGSPDHEVGAD